MSMATQGLPSRKFALASKWKVLLSVIFGLFMVFLDSTVVNVAFPTLRREFQALPLRAVTGRPTTVTWLVDGATIGTASSERTLSWPLAIGAHEIEARDADGRRARTSVVVK